MKHEPLAVGVANHYSSSLARDPLGGTSLERAIRGGSWNTPAKFSRAPNRGRYEPDRGFNYVGFRPTRSVLTSCDTNDDCAGLTPICGPTGICQSGHEGEPCDEVGQCSGSTTICSTAGICQDGSEGDACTGEADCASSQCSNDHCAPEGWAYIPAGTFCMGSPGGGGTEACPDDGPAELGRNYDEGPLHQVTLTRGFFLQETEVTQQQWLELFPDNDPSWVDFADCGLSSPVN